GAQRVRAQRREGASPWRAKQAPDRRRDNGEIEQTKITKTERPGGREAEQARPRHAVDAVNAAGEPFLVAKHEKDERAEGEREERKIRPPHTQRRIADAPAERKAYDERH